MLLHYQIVSILIFQFILLICLFIYVLKEIRSIKKKFNQTIKLDDFKIHHKNDKNNPIIVNYNSKTTNLS